LPTTTVFRVPTVTVSTASELPTAAATSAFICWGRWVRVLWWLLQQFGAIQPGGSVEDCCCEGVEEGVPQEEDSVMAREYTWNK